MVCQAIYKKKKNHPIETFQKITGASFFFFLIEIKKVLNLFCILVTKFGQL
jgi:hypothetical protein